MYCRSFPLRTILLSVMLFLLHDALAHAQIEVAPTRVLISARRRSAEVTVHNPTNDPVEVDTDLGFKLIRSDSLGEITLDTNVTSAEIARSCRDWVRIFPHHFVVPPGSSRSVRIMAIPPDTLAEGEYWGRAVFGCLPTRGGLPQAGDTTAGISTNVMMRLEFDIPIIFRIGSATTGISIDSVEARASGEGTRAIVGMTRLGNSAYRGTLFATLRAADGKEIATAEEQFTAEFGLRRGIMLPKLAPGIYTLLLESKSVKRGTANDAVIAAPTVQKAYELRVGEGGIEVVGKE